MYELQSYQTNLQPEKRAAADIMNVIPANTRVDSCIALNRITQTCDLTLQTNNDTVIKVTQLQRYMHIRIHAHIHLLQLSLMKLALSIALYCFTVLPPRYSS